MINIIVSHYNENLEWIKKLTNNNINNIYIYSKYLEQQDHNGIRKKNLNINFNNHEYFINLNKNIIYKNIPNVGRESETYLRYCYENYDNLSLGTIFLQGEPHVDINGIYEWIDHLLLPENKYTPNTSINTIFSGMKDGHVPMWYGKCDLSEYNCFTWLRQYIDPELYPYHMKIYFGACFGVSKDRILSRPRDFYRNLIDKELSTTNPEVAHFCERTWYYIFNCHKI